MRHLWLALPLFALAPSVLANSSSYATCPGTALSADLIPQGTHKLRVTWTGELQRPVVTDSEYFDSNAGIRYHEYDFFPGTTTWTISLVAPNGAVVFTQSYDEPLIPTPDGTAVYPVPTGGSIVIDVSAFTAAGDALFQEQSQACMTANRQTWALVDPPFLAYQDTMSWPLDGVGFTVSVVEEQGRVAFDFDAQAAALSPDAPKLLTHKYRDDDTFPSPFQRAASALVPITATRPQFTIDATVSNVPAGDPVYFRLIDPPDASDYVRHAGDAHAGDNADPAAALLTADGTSRAAVGQALAVTPDASGRVHLIIEGTDHAAGDNYQVEASFDQPFTCATAGPGGTSSCAQSAIVTAWKREYIEKHAMFRRSSWLAQDAAAGDTDVFVTDLRTFHTGDVVTFVHAKDAPNDSFDSETHVVGVVPQTQSVPAHLHLDDLPLARSYGRGPSPLHDQYLGDAIGITRSANPADDYYVPWFGPSVGGGTDPVQAFFATMYVELADAPVHVSGIPLYDRVDSGAFTPGNAPNVSAPDYLYAQRWFESSTGGVTANNHRQIIGARTSNSVGEIGLTTQPDLASSYTFRQTIDDLTSGGSALHGLDPIIVAMEDTAHELTHQWDVNPPVSSRRGHCSFNEYDDPHHFCRMHYDWGDVAAHNGERGDGIIKLHYEKAGGAVDSEYLTIRRAAEPMK